MVLLEGKKMQNRGGVCHVLILFFSFFFKFIFFFFAETMIGESKTQAGSRTSCLAVGFFFFPFNPQG